MTSSTSTASSSSCVTPGASRSRSKRCCRCGSAAGARSSRCARRPDTHRHKVQVLHGHCDAIGRDPDTITKSVNLGLAWRQGDLENQFGGIADFVKPGVLMGSVQEVVDRIGEYTDAGAEWVILAMRAPFDVDGLDRFAAEVL